jgi:hypothetical protein
VQSELGELSEMIGRATWRPRRQDQRNRLTQQAAADEPEDLSRGPVEPLCVIDDAQEWLVLRALGQEAERRQRNEKKVGGGAYPEAERSSERTALRGRETLEAVE